MYSMLHEKYISRGSWVSFVLKRQEKGWNANDPFYFRNFRIQFRTYLDFSQFAGKHIFATLTATCIQHFITYFCCEVTQKGSCIEKSNFECSSDFRMYFDFQKSGEKVLWHFWGESLMLSFGALGIEKKVEKKIVVIKLLNKKKLNFLWILLITCT